MRVVDAHVIEGLYTVADGPLVHDGRFWEGGLVEGMAQASAALLAKEGDPAAGISGRLVGLRNFVVHERPRVGQRIVYRVTLVRRFGRLMLLDGIASTGGDVLARGSLTVFS